MSPFVALSALAICWLAGYCNGAMFLAFKRYKEGLR